MDDPRQKKINGIIQKIRQGHSVTEVGCYTAVLIDTPNNLNDPHTCRSLRLAVECLVDYHDKASKKGGEIIQYIQGGKRKVFFTLE